MRTPNGVIEWVSVIYSTPELAPELFRIDKSDYNLEFEFEEVQRRIREKMNDKELEITVISQPEEI